MENISLRSVLPHVFKEQADLDSEVWKRNISFEKGKTYLVEAMSGTGKSTLCSYLLGYRNDYSGEILFDATDIRPLKTTDWCNLRQRHISHLFQELRLFPELTALENVLIKNKLADWKSEKEIVEWFHRLGIAEKLNAKVGKMSFGQQQRVAMMRALCQPFDFIMLDEPISHLDEVNAGIMAEIMTAEAKRQGAGIIVTSIGKHMALPYDKVFKL